MRFATPEGRRQHRVRQIPRVPGFRRSRGSSAWPSLRWLLHTILDAVVDEYQEIAGELEQETEELEELTLESLDIARPRADGVNSAGHFMREPVL